MQTFDYHPTTRVVFGEDALGRLGNLVAECGCSRALLVTDPGLLAAGHVERATDSLRSRAVTMEVFSAVEENPTTRHVELGLEVANNFKPDILVALGGGSAMDCAKGINFLHTNGGKMEDYWGRGKAERPMLPSVGIPTTAGTGSEAQSFALISQEASHYKMACGDLKARFRVAILDPTLLASAPAHVKMVTGIDAMSHAIESFVSTAATALSRVFSKESWRLLDDNYEMLLSQTESSDARGKMLLGAHFAGMAIENAMLGATHACANPLTANYGVAHGMAVGVMLPHVIRFNAETKPDLYDGLTRATGSRTADSRGNADALAMKISTRIATNGWPSSLQGLGVRESQLTELAKEAAQQWTAGFNPRAAGEAEMLALFHQAF